LPDATPTSIAPPSPAPRNKLWVGVQIAVTAVVLWFVAVKLVEQWRKFRGAPIEVHPRWGFIALSCLVVFATYAVLIETWRRMVIAWGGELSFPDAASIWFVSTLVRYVPGNTVVQVGAFAELARRRRVAPATAAGAAAINTVVAIATGFVVALLAGWRSIERLSHGNSLLYLAVAIVLLVGLLLLPAIMPALLQTARRVTGRSIPIGLLPRRAIYQSLAGNVIAWGLYGVAFQLFVYGVLGTVRGTTLDYIAVWAASYVIGYLALAMPAGLGARDVAQADALTMLGLATAGQGLTVAVTARLWLTLLELLPALFYLARGTRPRDPAP
jgi:glycosyltransferase 2 family protein